MNNQILNETTDNLLSITLPYVERTLSKRVICKFCHEEKEQGEMFTIDPPVCLECFVCGKGRNFTKGGD